MLKTSNDAEQVSFPKEKRSLYTREGSDPLVDEYALHILNDKLHCKVLGVHVCHFPLEAVVAHDGRREHDS